MALQSTFGAIITAMVTPFDLEDRIDEAATARLLAHLFATGSDGVVVCGTTGEASTMSDDEHLAMIRLVLDIVRSEHPGKTVIAGVGSNDTRHAVSLTERASALAPDALLSVNPYYNRPSTRGVIRHYEAIDRATELPILLYNIPQRTAANLDPEMLARLAEIEHVVGVKQANPRELQRIEGLSIYAGNDDLLLGVLEIGEAGLIGTSTHVFAPEFRRMVQEPDPQARLAIHAGLAEVHRCMGIAPAACTSKAALNLLGLGVGAPRLPYVELDEEELSVIRGLLARHGLLHAVRT
jgi:4-hydroxy-tetrahydrodipicolinate synthase